MFVMLAPMIITIIVSGGDKRVLIIIMKIVINKCKKNVFFKKTKLTKITWFLKLR